MIYDRVKMSQIAEASGLSVATISRALNERTAALVNSATKEKVLRAAGKLNYIPDRMARSLRTRQTNTFGYMMNFDTDAITGYMHELLSGIFNGLKGTGFDLKIVSPGNHKSLEEVMQMHGLDGIILPHCYKNQLPDLAKESQKRKGRIWPVVLLNDRHPRFFMNQIYSDNSLTTQCLVNYLADKGYKSFYFIGAGPGSPAADERKKAFLAVLAKRGIRFDAEHNIANGYFSEQGGYDRAIAFLKAKKDFRGVIFCINDAMALGAIRAIGETKLKCPKDVAVVGFDGIAAGEFSNPPLTTIKFDLYGMGRMAVVVLKDIMDGKRKEYVDQSVPFKLLERQSS